MNRKSFLKNILGAAASFAISPAVKNLLVSKPMLQAGVSSMAYSDGSLISDLNLLTPQYYHSYIKKYGGDNYTEWFGHFGGTVKEPVTITFTS